MREGNNICNMVVHTCNSSMGEAKAEDLKFKANLGLIKPKPRAGDVTHLIEQLPSKGKALS